MPKRKPQRASESDPAPVTSKSVKQISGKLADSKPALPPQTARSARQIRESEARRRVDESISQPLLRLWEDWDKAWPALLAELLDGDSDGYQAAGVALAEVGRLVVRVDEFRRRDLSELLVQGVPNLLINCPPFPLPADVLPRLRMMACSDQFHTLSPKLAAELLVSAANGSSAAELAGELADASTNTRSRDAFGWFFFIRDRLFPPPGPAPAGGTCTRTDEPPAVVIRDLHDIGLAERMLPGRMGGDADLPDEIENDEIFSTGRRDDEGPPTPSSEELPLEPWTAGVFAANLGKLVGRLQAWHANPFRLPLSTLAKFDDPAIAKVKRRMFREDAQPFIGRAEPATPDADGDEAAQQRNDRDRTLWLLGEVARQADAAPQGIVWDYLRGRIGELLETQSRTTATPPTDTAPLEFLVRQGRVVVVPREVGQPLLHGLEVAADRLLIGVAEFDSPRPRHANKAGDKKTPKGRPRAEKDNAKRRLFEDWQVSDLTKSEFIRRRFPADEYEEKMADLEAGRKQAEQEAKRQAVVEKEQQRQTGKNKK